MVVKSTSEIGTPREIQDGGGIYKSGTCEPGARKQCIDEERADRYIPPATNSLERPMTVATTGDDSCFAGESSCHIQDVPKSAPAWLNKAMTATAKTVIKVLAALNPLSLGGCGPGENSKPYRRDPNATDRTCWYPSGVEQGEICERIFVTEGGNKLYIEEGLIERNTIAPQTIDYFKNQLDVCEQEVMDDLEIDPARSWIEQALWSQELEACGKAPACGGYRTTWHSVDDYSLKSVNEEVLSEERTKDGRCHNLFSIVHELSHALRLPPMFTRTEEGLARYSEDLWAERNASDAVSNLLIEGAYRLGEEVWNIETEEDESVVETLDPITDIWIRSLEGGKVIFGYNASSGRMGDCTEDCSTSSVEMDSCARTFGNAISCAQVAPDDAIGVAIYDIAGFRRSKKMCSDVGFAGASEFNLPHATVVLQRAESLYSDYDLFAPDMENGDENTTAIYSIYYCFYDRIRQEGGALAVKQIIWRMMDAGRDHKDEQVPFPFFQTVREVTGLSELETEDLFDTHQVPTSDASHLVGGEDSLEE